MRILLILFVLVISLVACNGEQMEEELVTETAVSGKFTPPPGKTLFIIGQDNDTIDEYMRAIPSPEPGGVTSYTSLKNLQGLGNATDYGAGTIHLAALAAQHPNSVISLGLSVVDYLDEINNGQADENIDSLLDHLAAYDRPVFLRFGYEFDGTWNRYEPEPYKQAWIIIHNRIQEKGIDNIAMVWQSATYCLGTYWGEPIESWYPGDEYVDWIGFSYFIQQECDLEPIEELVAFAREHNKPVISAESAPQRYETGNLTFSITGNKFEERTAEQIWEEWYVPFFTYIDDNRDIIRVVAYINTYWDSQPMWGPPYPNGYWGDSRVQANTLILERWQAELAQDKWLFGNKDLNSILES